MFKVTASKGKLNGGLALGGIVAAAVPIIATIATAGAAAVPIALWIGLGGALSTLLAGNVVVKSPVERALDKDARENGADE